MYRAPLGRGRSRLSAALLKLSLVFFSEKVVSLQETKSQIVTICNSHERMKTLAKGFKTSELFLVQYSNDKRASLPNHSSSFLYLYAVSFQDVNDYGSPQLPVVCSSEQRLASYYSPQS